MTETQTAIFHSNFGTYLQEGTTPDLALIRELRESKPELDKAFDWSAKTPKGIQDCYFSKMYKHVHVVMYCPYHT